MLTNKQSLLLCAFVVIGFSVFGATGILDNYVVASILVFGFIAVLVNIYLKITNRKK